MKVKRIVSVSIMISIGVVLGIVESLIPSGVPGVKIGLANIVTLLSFYIFDFKDAIIVHILRIFLVGLIYSGILSQGFLLSLAGGILSLIVMLIVYFIKKDSIYMISLFGSIFHSIGQIILSMIILSSKDVLYYLPIIFSLSIPCGLLTAYLSSLILKPFKIVLPKFKLVPVLLSLIVTISFLTLSIILYTGKSDKRIAHITYQNNLIMDIDLEKPSSYKNFGDEFIKIEKENDSYLYYFNFYNKDSKEINEFIIEVKNQKIKIKKESCKKGICSHIGYIDSKYERLICLPNELIVSIEYNSLDDFDAIE